MAADDKHDRELLLGMAETLQADNAALKVCADAALGEAARVQARLAEVENQLDRLCRSRSGRIDGAARLRQCWEAARDMGDRAEAHVVE